MKTYIIEENGEEIRRFTQEAITEKFLRDQRVKGRTVIQLSNPAKPDDTEDNTWERGDETDMPASLGDETYLVRERPWVSAPFPVPPEVTPRQFQLATEILFPGLLVTIEAAVDAHPDPLVKISWRKALGVKRGDPTLEAMRQHPSIDKTSEEVDAIFRLAATL